jgi:hypothetical protein
VQDLPKWEESCLQEFQARVLQYPIMADLERQTLDVEVPEIEKQDPNLVDFDGPNDTENPFNWPRWKKGRQLVLMAFNTFIT